MAKQSNKDYIIKLMNLIREYTHKFHRSGVTPDDQGALVELINANTDLIVKNINNFEILLEIISTSFPETTSLVNKILPDKSLSLEIKNLAAKVEKGYLYAVDELQQLLHNNSQEVFNNLYTFRSLWKLTENGEKNQAIFSEFANVHNEEILSSKFIIRELSSTLGNNATYTYVSAEILSKAEIHYNDYIYNDYIYRFLEENLLQIINLESSSGLLLEFILYKTSCDKEINEMIDDFFLRDIDNNTPFFFSNKLLLKHLISGASENSDIGQRKKEWLFSNVSKHKKEVLKATGKIYDIYKMAEPESDFLSVFLNTHLSLDEAREVFLESDSSEYLLSDYIPLLFHSLALELGEERDEFISKVLNKHAEIILDSDDAVLRLFQYMAAPMLTNFIEKNIDVITKKFVFLNMIMNILKETDVFPKELIATIFNQDTLATIKIKSKLPVEMLKKWGIQPNQFTNKLIIDDSIVTNSSIKSILSKINCHFAMSEQDNVVLQKNLSQCLEIAMQHNDIKAVLKLSHYYMKTIDLYKGLSFNTSGDYNREDKTISIEKVAPLLLASEHSRETAMDCANIISTLIHELMHNILDKTFDNRCIPFSSNDSNANKQFEAIKDLVIKEYRDHYIKNFKSTIANLSCTEKGELIQYLPSSLDIFLAEGCVNYNLIHSYMPEEHNAEIPAWYLTQLSQLQFTSDKEVFEGQLLLQNQDLISYMHVLFKIIHQDGEVLANIEEYIPNHDAMYIVLDYSREHIDILGSDEIVDLSVLSPLST